MESKENKHLNRKSYFKIPTSRRDEGRQLGFDYRDQLMSRSLSSFMFGDKKRDDMIAKLNDLFVYMIDSVKNIKKTFNFAIKRNSRNIN